MLGALELLLCVLLAPANTSPGATPASANSAPIATAEEVQAKQAFTEGRYTEAATQYETLWSSSPTPKFLFNAAMARELAEHEAHAYLHLRRYLALPSLQPAEREKGLARLEALMKRTVRLRVESTPEAQLTLTLELKPGGAATDVGRVPLKLESETLRLIAAAGAPGAYELYVEPGTWMVAAEAQGYVTVRRDLSVRSNEPQTGDLRLTPEAIPPTSVVATFSPPSAIAAGITVTVENSSERTQHVVPSSGELTLRLPPGSWTVRADAPGFASEAAKLTLTGEPQALTISLNPVSGPAVDDRRRTFARGLQIGGGVTMTLGLGLAVAGGLAFQPTHTDLIRDTCERVDYWCYNEDALRGQRRALRFYDTGALLAGFGVTALGYGVAAARVPVGERWKIRVGIGAALASLGLVAALSTYKAPQGLEDVIFAPSSDLTSFRLGGLLSANLLGFALIGSGAALLALAPIEYKRLPAARAHVRAKFTPQASLTGAGLNFDLKF